MLAGLRRVTRDGRWIPEIDSLRLIAIASVVLFHLHMQLMLRTGGAVPVQPRYAWMANLLEHGNRGVTLFFVISGFILGLPFARQRLLNGRPVSIGRYFLRRVTRLEPPYIASYVVALLMYGVYTHGAGINRHYLERLGAGILYSHGTIFHAMNPVNAVTWSLEIEIQFYLLAPLFALIFLTRSKNLRRGLLLLLIVGCSILQPFPVPNSSPLFFSIAHYAQYFLAGFLLADLHLIGSLKRSYLWDFVALGWIFYFAAPETRWFNVTVPLLLLALCASALYGKLTAIFFANTTAAVIGGMCYSIYLLHFMLIAAIFKLTHGLIVWQDYLATFLLQITCTAIPVVLLCALFYRWIELPCMDPEWPAKLRKWIQMKRSTEMEKAEPQETS